jgi:ubiquinone/menaquinone biosynthesis C-methylase UbiE|tara:strand:- start:1015 stop:1593 length:579 start_codon:yes stop_codon:yes gene_type:complete
MVDAYMHLQYGDRKKVLFENHPDVIVEIGAGYGANFRYLRKGTKVKIIEPNKGFFDMLKYRAEKFGISVEIYEATAEDIPLSENTSEMVISSLVLCSVTNPPKTLSEIKRILKKGGVFVYIEHVRAHKHSWIYKVQKSLKTSWKWFFDGCNLTRETGRIIQHAGFSKVKQTEFSNKTIFLPIIPHIAGVATK